MKKMILFACAALFVLAAPAAAVAADTAAAPAAAPASVPVAPVHEESDKITLPDTPDTKERLALATKMHEIRPAREQIDMAVQQVSELLAPGDRDAFQVAMKKMLDYKALEHRSIEAMASVFTVDELKAMVEFYSKPEAKHISEKLEEYNKLIEPEVFKMLDAAMMEVRSGKARN